MSGRKCKQCGSSDIEVDPSRGDAVCTSCGTVLEDNIIVAEVEFQESAGGGASAIGQFVSADTKGGATGFGGAFNVGIGQESREVTLRKARNGIMALCQQLRLNQQCIEIACNFFKMALCRHLTKGRPASHIHAACVYITCRTEGTARKTIAGRQFHTLVVRQKKDLEKLQCNSHIADPDALQICCYQLGRTYFRLSRALCINIPSIDPCIYILRFAAQLQFGERKHEVSMTALRLVQRMKRDSIHSGRRPSGLCGAALLIAARLHEFSRSPADVVRIVKVHESTLRKRLLEFGETPSSALTLDEFMTVDLEEEQDPPAFRAARKRDKERLQKLMEEEGGEGELSQLQREIDLFLEKDSKKKKPPPIEQLLKPSGEEASREDVEAERFAVQETLDILGDIAEDVVPGKGAGVKGLGPDIALMGLTTDSDNFVKPAPKLPFGRDLSTDELVMSEKDEDDVSTLIMSPAESDYKTRLWHKINSGYLREQKIKEELRAKEREENKDKKKKVRGQYKKKNTAAASSAGEAIEKMLQEKRISSKINYDILKSLDGEKPADAPEDPAAPSTPKRRLSTTISSEPIVLTSPVVAKRSRRKAPVLPVPSSPAPATPAPPTPTTSVHTPLHSDVADDYDADDVDTEVVEPSGEMESLSAMLHTSQEDDYYEYEEY